MRRVGFAALAAVAAALAACEKAEDRTAGNSLPKFDLRYCLAGSQAPTLRMPAAGCIVSDNRAYVLDMTRKGEIEVRAIRNSRPAEAVWTSRIQGKKADDSEAVFQTDGNLVVYEGAGALWSSGPLGAGDYRLSVTDDGNLVIRAADGRPLWMARFDAALCAHVLETPNQLTSGCLISPSGTYAMVLTSSADLEVAPVEGKALGKPIWTAGAAGSPPPASMFVVQTDGNLVVYDAGKPIWNSQTGGRSGVFRLELTDQGELLLHGPDGGVLWSSKSSRGAKV
jgi:hypothetical protein